MLSKLLQIDAFANGCFLVWSVKTILFAAILYYSKLLLSKIQQQIHDTCQSSNSIFVLNAFCKTLHRRRGTYRSLCWFCKSLTGSFDRIKFYNKISTYLNSFTIFA